jgi:hypothetical protein
MVTKTKFKAGCGVAAVFGAGFLCGAVALFIFIVRIIPLSEGWRDEESKEFVTRHLARQLDLTDEQVEQVKPVVAEVLEARYRHRRTYVEADIELTGTGFEKILPILTEEQKERAKEVFANWKKGKERFTRAGAAPGSNQ